jgi:hypothetical protein
MDYKLIALNKKPKSKYRRKSKYDVILDEFLNNKADLVEFIGTGKNIYYLRSQINKLIVQRNLQINVSVIN